MTTTRAIAHNTVVQIGGKIISTVLGLLAIAMMTRYLGQEKFGWYVTVISFLGFVGILTDFGLVPVTAQMMSEPTFDKQKLLKNLLGFRFTTAVVFLGLAPLVAWFFPYPREAKIAITFTTLSFLGVAINQVLLGYYQTKLKMHIPAIGEMAGRISLLISLYLLISSRSSFLWVMGAVALSGLVYTAVIWLAAKKDTPVGFAFDWDVWGAITRKMWPIAISIIFNVVYLKGDVILLSLLRGQTEVGIYGAAYRVLDIVAQLAMMLMGILLPLMAYSFSRDLKEDFKKYYQQSFNILMMFAIPMLVGIFLLAQPIMVFVAGNEFATSGLILRILGLAVFGVYLGAVFGHAAVAINKQKKVIWVYCSDAIITLIGYLIFIPRNGMVGAAWMTVFSELYAGVLLFLTVWHYSGERPRLHMVWKIILASILMGCSLLVFPQYHVLLRIFIGCITYGCTLFALGAISKETIKEITSFRRE